MTGVTWESAIAKLHTWKRGNRRAVHKPLMVLLLIARAQRGAGAELRYADFHEDHARLLDEFGPPHRTSPEYPFWHLETDRIWLVRDRESLGRGKGGPSHGALLSSDATGVVPAPLWSTLSSDPALQDRLVQHVLDEFWPTTYHEPLRRAVGLRRPDRPRETVTRAKRDPAFRAAVLDAYGGRCAVCGYAGTLRGDPLGVEAAHIQWHCYDGPDELANALALCSLHHVALDRGAIGIAEDYRVQMSPHVAGEGTDRWLAEFDRQPLLVPATKPAAEYLRWHGIEVFKS